MKIRRCPACAQLIHFDPPRLTRACWSCGRVCDARSRMVFEEALAARAWALLEALLDWLPPCSRLVGVGRVALAAAFPIAVLMLLLCNGFDIRIVEEPASPFFRR